MVSSVSFKDFAVPDVLVGALTPGTWLIGSVFAHSTWLYKPHTCTCMVDGPDRKSFLPWICTACVGMTKDDIVFNLDSFVIVRTNQQFCS